MSTPAIYSAAGFRVLPILSDGTKRPAVGGFGKDTPDFTIPPENFGPADGCAILTGPCPAFGADGDWLAVIDLDGETRVAEINDHVGVALPPTLSSKGYRHLYYRVEPGPERESLRQWVRIFGRGDVPEVDLKWAGGYAIEPPNSWDGSGWDPARIAPLPVEWIRAVLRLRNAPPQAHRAAVADDAAAKRVPLEQDAAFASMLGKLVEVWPRPGEGCHEAALALGGILGDSWWDEDAIATFTSELFAAVGSKNRTSDVLTSVTTRRAGGECKGWPSLKALLKDAARGDVDGAMRALKTTVPGLSAPKVVLPPVDDTGRATAKPGREALKLSIGSDDEIAVKVVAEHLADAVYDEGELWRYDADTGVWVVIPAHQLSGWIEVYDGVVYDVTDKGKAIWVKLGQGRVTSIQRRIEAKRAMPGFFSGAPTGLAFRNGFLRLPGRHFEPLSPDHRARHLLPCDFGLDAARKAPPVNWVRYLRSIWGNDTQSIELVHQLLGYLLSGRHDHQKIFVLLGPPRAGKGTLLGLIQAIFRDQAGPFKVASLDQNFAMQSMLGKTVVYDPDVRRASSMFKSEGQMVERLLSISAHDTQTIPRKNQQDVLTALPARLLLAANPPFGLTDVGGALASRFVILTFPRSFLGSEDLGLGARLEAEIPSIVALALDGLDRLDRVGRFVEPESSAEERESVERAQNPMLAFLADECELGPDFTVAGAELWAAAVRWRDVNGHRRMSSQAFAEFLRQRGVTHVRPRQEGDRLPRVYHGIRLRVQAGSGPKLVAVPDPERPIGAPKHK